MVTKIQHTPTLIPKHKIIQTLFNIKVYILQKSFSYSQFFNESLDFFKKLFWISTRNNKNRNSF